MLIWNWAPGDVWSSRFGEFSAAGVQHKGGRWAGFWTAMWASPLSCGSSGPQPTKERAFEAAEAAAQRFARGTMTRPAEATLL